MQRMLIYEQAQLAAMAFHAPKKIPKYKAISSRSEKVAGANSAEANAILFRSAMERFAKKKTA